MTAAIFALLFLGLIAAMVARIKGGRPFRWSYGDKRSVEAAVYALVAALLVLKISVPDNPWSILWLLPALVLILVLVSMSTEWPATSWGDYIDYRVWGRSVPIPDDDPRRTPGEEGYETKYDPAHADYDDTLTDTTTRHGIIAMRAAGIGLIALTLIFGAGKALSDLAKVPNAAPPQSPAPVVTPTDTASATPVITPGKLPSFTCSTPKLGPFRSPSTSNLHAAGVESCVSGNWVKWSAGDMQIVALYGGADAHYTYYTFKLDGKDVLIRVE